MFRQVPATPAVPSPFYGPHEPPVCPTPHAHGTGPRTYRRDCPVCIARPFVGRYRDAYASEADAMRAARTLQHAEADLDSRALASASGPATARARVAAPDPIVARRALADDGTIARTAATSRTVALDTTPRPDAATYARTLAAETRQGARGEAREQAATSRHARHPGATCAIPGGVQALSHAERRAVAGSTSLQEWLRANGSAHLSTRATPDGACPPACLHCAEQAVRAARATYARVTRERAPGRVRDAARASLKAACSALRACATDARGDWHDYLDVDALPPATKPADR